MRHNGTISRNSIGELMAAIQLAERRSFRAAADYLGISPTALSSNIRTLEDRLGVRLFNRTTRSVSLTAAGAEFIARVAPALAEIERAAEEAGSRAGAPSGLLRINSSVTGAHQVLAPVLRDFSRRHPLVSIELTTETRLVDIVLNGCDAGVRLEESVPADMVAVPLPFGLDFCVVAAPAYLREHPAPGVPADLLHHRCIRSVLPGGGTYRWEFERGGEALALDVPGNLTLDNQLLLFKAAIEGMGIAYIARSICSDAIEAGQLSLLLEPWMPRSSRLCLYYPHNRNTSPALRALVDTIRAAAPEREEERRIAAPIEAVAEQPEDGDAERPG
ncbi:LysR family transcriptional regulator [Sphingomonas sp. Sphisp140]|uniref:LysR family transcriptional regulator n=2 Tax=unclassified Sphingomonas TaxID=196159 RepID=UPI0039AEB80F